MADTIRIIPTTELIGSAPKQEEADPCAMVIFGAGGDLTKRLVVPALYNLSRTRSLPDNFALIGVDLAEGTTDSWRDHLYEMLQTFVGSQGTELSISKIDAKAWDWLAERMSYIQGDLTTPDLYAKIGTALANVQNTLSLSWSRNRNASLSVASHRPLYLYSVPWAFCT